MALAVRALCKGPRTVQWVSGLDRWPWWSLLGRQRRRRARRPDSTRSGRAGTRRHFLACVLIRRRFVSALCGALQDQRAAEGNAMQASNITLTSTLFQTPTTYERRLASAGTAHIPAKLP